MQSTPQGKVISAQPKSDTAATVSTAAPATTQESTVSAEIAPSPQPPQVVGILISEASQESQELPEVDEEEDGGKPQSEPKSVVSSSGDVDDSQDLIDIEAINCETLLDDNDDDDHQPSSANPILGHEDRDILLPINADNTHQVSPIVDLGTDGDGITTSEQSMVTVIQNSSSGAEDRHTDDDSM